MKSFFGLLKNEMQKTIKQLGFKIILIILAVIIALAPFGILAIEKLADLTTYTYYYYDDEERFASLLDMVSSHEAEGEYYWAASCYSDYYAHQFLNESGKSYEDPEYQCYFGDIQTGIFNEKYISYYANGSVDLHNLSPRLVSDFQFIVGEFDEELASRVWNAEINANDYYDVSGVISVSELEALCNKIKQKTDETKAMFMDFHVEDYYKKLQGEFRTQVENNKLSIEELTETLKDTNLTKEEKANYEYSLRRLELQLECSERLIQSINILIENKSEYGGWEYQTFTMLMNVSDQIPSAIPVDEFSFNPSNYGYSTYSEYVEAYESTLKNLLLVREEGDYSLEHGIPLKASGGSTAKFRFETQLSISGSLILIFFIVLAGTTFASEYSSGSIRLLLIRPQSRSKIWASKTIAMLIWGLLLTVYSVVILSVIDGIIYGFDGLFTNTIYVYNGQIHEISAVSYILMILAQDAISILPYAFIALLLSIVIRRSPLAIALPLILNMAATLLQAVCLYAWMKGYKFLFYTILPYIELGTFRVDPSSQYFNTMTFDSLLSSAIDYGFIKDSFPWFGAGQLIFVSVAACFFSWLCFKKQQIKN